MRHRFLSLLAAIVLAGCASSNPPSGQKMELRVYTVAPESTDHLVNALNTTFSTGDKIQVGKASSPSAGQILVLAPESLQDSIAASLKTLAGTAPAGNATLAQVTFWSVDAVSEGADDPRLADLSGALEETRKALGPVHFVLRERITATAAAGRDAHKEWMSASDGVPASPKSLRFRLDGSQTGFTVWMQYEDPTLYPSDTSGHSMPGGNSGFESWLPARMGQTVVLSQGPAFSHGDDAKSLVAVTRLYIVRIDPVTKN
ncbi:MAG TPA: hypothetical protein VF132_08405 [Rudaea sp.]